MDDEKSEWICDDRFYAPGGFAERLRNMSPSELKAYGEEMRKRFEERNQTSLSGGNMSEEHVK